jgi:hypothetical protein
MGSSRDPTRGRRREKGAGIQKRLLRGECMPRFWFRVSKPYQHVRRLFSLSGFPSFESLVFGIDVTRRNQVLLSLSLPCILSSSPPQTMSFRPIPPSCTKTDLPVRPHPTPPSDIENLEDGPCRVGAQWKSRTEERDTPSRSSLPTSWYK